MLHTLVRITHRFTRLLLVLWLVNLILFLTGITPMTIYAADAVDATQTTQESVVSPEQESGESPQDEAEQPSDDDDSSSQPETSATSQAGQTSQNTTTHSGKTQPTPSPTPTLSPTPTATPTVSTQEAMPPSPTPSPSVSPSPTPKLSTKTPEALTELPSPSPSPISDSTDQYLTTATSAADMPADVSGLLPDDEASDSALPATSSAQPAEPATSTAFMETGDAVATGFGRNDVNTSMHESNLALLDLNTQGMSQEELDLTEWMYAQFANYLREATQSAGPENSEEVGLVDNEATVSAQTGYNRSEGADEALMKTGNAAAVGTLLNNVNNTYLRSVLGAWSVTLVPNTVQRLIIPRSDQIWRWWQEWQSQFAGQTLTSSPTSPKTESTSQVNTTIQLTANTGENDQDAPKNGLSTGNALTSSFENTVANTLWKNAGWYQVVFHNAGQAQLQGWNSALQSELLRTGLNQFTALSGGMVIEDHNSQYNSGAQSSQAEVNSTLTVSADTGSNSLQASRSTFLDTGNALAVGNVVNLVDSTWEDSTWWQGFVQILPGWSGEVQAAHPELTLTASFDAFSVAAGEQRVLTIDVQNTGYDQASDVVLEVLLPAQLKSESGSSLSWPVGSLSRGQNKQLVSSLTFPEADLADGESLKFVVRAVSSDELMNPTKAQRSVSLQWEAATIENMSSSTENVIRAESLGSQSLFGELGLSISHNVSDFVRPGDVVTYQAWIRNDNDWPISDVGLEVTLFDQTGNQLAAFLLPLGELPAHRSGRSEFGVAVPLSIAADTDIITTVQAVGLSPYGDELHSSLLSSVFAVETNGDAELVTIPPLSGDVAGVMTQRPGQVLAARMDGMLAGSQTSVLHLYQALFASILGWLAIRMKRYLVDPSGT